MAASKKGVLEDAILRYYGGERLMNRRMQRRYYLMGATVERPKDDNALTREEINNGEIVRRSLSMNRCHFIAEKDG